VPILISQLGATLVRHRPAFELTRDDWGARTPFHSEPSARSHRSLFNFDLVRLFETARSLRAGLRASAAAGRGFRLRDSGDLRGALAQARIGLAILSQAFVQRTHATEASALISLTALAEESAVPLHERGASMVDLLDSIAALKLLSGVSQSDAVSAVDFFGGSPCFRIFPSRRITGVSSGPPPAERAMLPATSQPSAD